MNIINIKRYLFTLFSFDKRTERQLITECVFCLIQHLLDLGFMFYSCKDTKEYRVSDTHFFLPKVEAGGKLISFFFKWSPKVMCSN